MAPFYRTYRTYFNHIETEWYLADIPNFPFHYIRYVYGKDKEAKFICISEDKFDDPLMGVKDKFDLIIVSEVFEHLHKPKYIAEYLLNRLNPQGLFYFDYVKSSGNGYDNPQAVRERIPTLQLIAEKLDIIDGVLTVDGSEFGVCIGVKK